MVYNLVEHHTLFTHNLWLNDKMSKQNLNFLSSKAEEIFFNVSETFEMEQNTRSKSFLDQTADVTCVSQSTIDQVPNKKVVTTEDY